jgi:hypothetical protein
MICTKCWIVAVNNVCKKGFQASIGHNTCIKSILFERKSGLCLRVQRELLFSAPSIAPRRRNKEALAICWPSRSRYLDHSTPVIYTIKAVPGHLFFVRDLDIVGIQSDVVQPAPKF